MMELLVWPLLSLSLPLPAAGRSLLDVKPSSGGFLLRGPRVFVEGERGRTEQEVQTRPGREVEVIDMCEVERTR